nr:ribonuclease III [Hymenolepis microstoma]
MSSSKKNVIYINEQDLANLPDEIPVYVLSKDSEKSTSPLLPLPSVSSTSNGLNCAPTFTTFPFCVPNIPVPYPPPLSVPQNVNIPPLCFHYPPPMPFPTQFVPSVFPPPMHLSPPPNVTSPISNSTDPSSDNSKSSSKAAKSSDSDCGPSRDNYDQKFYSNISCTPAKQFFEKQGECAYGTDLMIDLENRFEQNVLNRRKLALSCFPPVDMIRPALKRQELVEQDSGTPVRLSKNGRKRPNSLKGITSSTSETSMNNQSGTFEDFEAKAEQQKMEVAHKEAHPYRLHPKIWHNEEGEYNSGPACACKTKYRIGPLHNQFEGEAEIPRCNLESNNRDRLYHYRIMVTPTDNFFFAKPTTITHNGNDYTFDGYSIFLHTPIDDLPPCQLLRFNILYDLYHAEESFPENFTVRALDMLTQYVFKELLELLDLNWRPHGVESGCPVVHLLPRFVRELDDSSAELLSSNVILEHWMNQSQLPLFQPSDLLNIHRIANSEWSAKINDLRGTLAWKPGAKPPAIRIDQLDRISSESSSSKKSFRSSSYPFLVHMTYTPMKLSLSRDPQYKSVLKNYLKLQYLMYNKPRISPEDRDQLSTLKRKLDQMDFEGVHRREITVELSCEGFYRTAIRPDVTQFALNMASFVIHIRCILSLKSLEKRLGYEFKDKSILYQALTHPSYRRTDFGTNQDHYQNTLTSCGPRIIKYGDKLRLYKNSRKKGLTKMFSVMSMLPKQREERSDIYGNERLEFLGDAVIEIIASIHLFFMFPEMSEGSLDHFRQALVQNQHLSDLALRIGLHKYLLYTHSVDFCHDSTYVFARSDAFEAVMAAIALDGGLDAVDRIFGAVLFGDDPKVHQVWVKIPPHPLQAKHPKDDREWVSKVPTLTKLFELENQLGIHFKHIRVLARALTVRKTGCNIYTLGDNQRLEFLGDSLLKYVTTDYLFKHFPRHHEGHLSLLKNSLVNKYTQARVCSEIGLDQYVIRREDNMLKISNISEETFGSTASRQNVKNKADLLEAFIGALYVDRDITWVERFCQVCFWPRLVEFILTQEWNDPKSRLQQCCLTDRSLNEDPELAHYKLLSSSGPSNDRVYRVGVYFRNQLLAEGVGRSLQNAEKDAATKALEIHQDVFKQLGFQREVINKRYSEPYINKVLTKVQNYEPSFVEKFVEDKSLDEGGSSRLELGSKRRRIESTKYVTRCHNGYEEETL